MKRTLALTAFALTACLAPAAEEDKKQVKGPLELHIVLAKDTVAWDADGKSPKEFQKQLAQIEEQQKQNPQKEVSLPPAPKLDLTLEVRNTGKETVTVFVGGDVNQYTLDLKGTGVKQLKYNVLTTADLRLPKAVAIEPGKSYEVKVKQLEDGFRGMGRRTYWMEPGEYTLTATYRLGTQDGGQGVTLTSAPVKIKVTEAK